MSYTNTVEKKIANDHPNCCIFKVDLEMNHILDTSDYEEDLVDKLQSLRRCKNLEFLILNKNTKAKRAVLYTCLYFGLFDGKERSMADCARTVKRRTSIIGKGILKISAMLRKEKSKTFIANESGNKSSNIEKTYNNYADFLQSCIDDETDLDVKKRLSKIKKDCINYHAEQDIIK